MAPSAMYVGWYAIVHGYCWRSRPNVVPPVATKSCGTSFVFRYGRVASFCSVPSELKIAKTSLSSTRTRVWRTVSDGMYCVVEVLVVDLPLVHAAARVDVLEVGVGALGDRLERLGATPAQRDGAADVDRRRRDPRVGLRAAEGDRDSEHEKRCSSDEEERGSLGLRPSV